MGAMGKACLRTWINRVSTLLPGLLAAILLAWLSLWLSDWIGEKLLGFDKTPISAVLPAILLGLVIRAAVPLPQVLKPGLGFGMKEVLRLGIILLGIRLTIFDVVRLGAYGVPIVLLCIGSALLITARINGWLQLPERLGALIAVGTSICGVSAIVATGPAIDAKEEEVAYAVAVITIFGLFATLVYPYVANTIFGGEALSAGLFLGTSVHDTSQVVGAAKAYADVFSAPQALDAATVTKLVRNVFMAIVLPLMAFRYSRTAQEPVESGGKMRFLRLLPLFIVGFLVLAVVRSAGDAAINAGGNAFGLWDQATWQSVHSLVKGWAETLMVIALAAVGLSTDLRAFKGLGLRPLLAGLSAALAAGIVSYIAISLLGNLVTL
ncbi:MAG: putative sulfate exporter family transporter [Anaerolineae bacterium]|jgi:uncharacterized integral membrane protein (TIGR00698 family)